MRKHNDPDLTLQDTIGWRESGSAAPPVLGAPDLASTWHLDFTNKIDVADDLEFTVGEIGRRFGCSLFCMSSRLRQAPGVHVLHFRYAVLNSLLKIDTREHVGKGSVASRNAAFYRAGLQDVRWL